MENVNWVLLKDVGIIVITLVAALLTSRILRLAFTRVVMRRYAHAVEIPTTMIFFKNSISFVIFTMALLFLFMTVEPLKQFGNAAFASAGIVAAILAFASQKAMSNIFGGLFILVFKPFQVGDLIRLSNQSIGTVEELTLRHTVIRDLENRRVVIPNSIISDDTIVNSTLTDERIRQHLEFGISYESNIEKAMEIIIDEAMKHPSCIDGRTSEEIEQGAPIIQVKVVALSDFSVNIRAWIWSRDHQSAMLLRWDLLKSVKERFDQEDIEIPYPHRTMVTKTEGKVI